MARQAKRCWGEIKASILGIHAFIVRQRGVDCNFFCRNFFCAGHDKNNLRVGVFLAIIEFSENFPFVFCGKQPKIKLAFETAKPG